MWVVCFLFWKDHMLCYGTNLMTYPTWIHSFWQNSQNYSFCLVIGFVSVVRKLNGWIIGCWNSHVRTGIVYCCIFVSCWIADCIASIAQQTKSHGLWLTPEKAIQYLDSTCYYLYPHALYSSLSGIDKCQWNSYFGEGTVILHIHKLLFLFWCKLYIFNKTHVSSSK